MIRLIGLTIAMTLALGTAALGAVPTPPPPPPPVIILSVDASVCGQVTVTAHGFGITPGTTYQLVANQSVASAVGSLDNTATATIPALSWGTVAIRTASGGYLASSTLLGAGTAWYFAKAC